MITLNKNDSLSIQPNELRVASLSNDTARYLSGKAGTIIEAKVVRIASELANPAPNIPGKPLATANTNSSATRSSGDSQSYRVELNVNGKTLIVESALAPRRGQVLKLEVLDAQNLRILLDATSTPTAKQSGNNQGAPALQNSQNSAATISGQSVTKTTTPGTSQPTTISGASNQTSQPQVSVKNDITLIQQIQSALRDNLPKQKSLVEFDKTDVLLTELRNSLESSGAPLWRSATSNQVTQQSFQQLLGQLATVLTGASNTDKVQTAAASVSLPGQKPGATASTPAQQPVSAVKTSTEGAVRPPTILNGLRQLLDTLQSQLSQQNTLAQLSSPRDLQNIILNSGAFYEAKLVNAAKAAYQSIQNTSTSSNERDIAIRREQLTEIIRNIATSPSITGDSKHQQLKLSANLASLIGQLRGSSDISSQVEAQNRARTELDVHALWNLASSPSSTTTATPGNESALSDALVLILKQTLAQTARTQSQQLLSLGSQFSSAEGSSNQSLNLNIPLWINSQFKPIDLLLEWENEKREEQEPRPDTRAWNIRLRFDIGELGELVALASVREKKLSALFWAESQALAQEVEKGLTAMTNNLTSAGIAVNQLHCKIGKPELSDDYQSLAQQITENLLKVEI